MIAAQAGYWKLMASPERYRVYAMLNFVGVPLTRALGYTPGWAGLGEDLPKDVFLQWVGWVMSPRYLFDDAKLDGAAEFSEISGRDARAVHFRRSLGDAAGGRIAVLGIYLDQARDPHRDAGGCRRERESAISDSSAPNIATRCGEGRRNGSRRGGNSVCCRHCERSEAIHSAASGDMDCFAEPVIGRAFARPVGSQ